MEPLHRRFLLGLPPAIPHGERVPDLDVVRVDRDGKGPLGRTLADGVLVQAGCQLVYAGRGGRRDKECQNEPGPRQEAGGEGLNETWSPEVGRRGDG